MTKKLTEQWREGTLPEGLYYIEGKGNYDIALIRNRYCPVLTSPYCEDNVFESEFVPVAPVPSYRQLYGSNDGNIPVGLFTVLNLIKRNIEQYQKIRPLTDLECGIKSQVVSLLKKWGVK